MFLKTTGRHHAMVLSERNLRRLLAEYVRHGSAHLYRDLDFSPESETISVHVESDAKHYASPERRNPHA